MVVDDYQPWSSDKIDLQVDPLYLPSNEEKSVMVQVGLALLEDTLRPIVVYLWRDERNIFLRREAELWKFGKKHITGRIIKNCKFLAGFK